MLSHEPDLVLTEAGWTGSPAPIGPDGRSTIAPGAVLAHRYEVLRLLGQGGMGVAYQARDVELDRIVALKVIRPELANHRETLQRFKQELILARQITHRNVIRIFDLGIDAGLKFITMEYIEGQDLAALLEQRSFTVEESVRVIRQVCQALEAAHAEGVIHRDLKPQNIMLDQRQKVSVMDFGLARSAELASMTMTAALLGTPAYMSPEQARSEPLDRRSDLFSLGIIFYELLTRTRPFQADTTLGSLLLRTQTPPRPVRELDAAIPEPIGAIVEKCLAIDPALRYQSAAEILSDLDAVAGGRQPEFSCASPASLRPPEPRSQRPARRVPRKGLVVAAAALLVLAAVAVVGVRTRSAAPAAAHPPVTVLVADFDNHTGDPIFEGTLEPMFSVALEGASFISAYGRGDAHKLARQLPHPTDKLDEQAARLIAVSQGLGAVVTGSLSRRGDGYKLSAEALDAGTGNTIAHSEASAATKDEVLLAVPKLVAPIRTALGDATPESVQLTAARGTFTAASLEVVHEYAAAMEQQAAGKWQPALDSFKRVAGLDPNFARAYSGMAAASVYLGRRQDGEKYIKLAMEHVDRMTERERYHTRAFYYWVAGDYHKCVEEYGTLVGLYPADRVAHNNLANCASEVRNLPKAVEEMQRAVEISPKGAIQRMNLSVFASYAGNFQAGEREAKVAQQLNPSYEKAYVALAFAQLGQGQLSQAAETYQKLEKVGARGASFAAFGLADLALYEGRFQDAARILERGAAADLAARNSDAAAAKFAVLGYVRLLQGHRSTALEAAQRALASGQTAKLKFLAGRVFAAAGEIAKARKLSAGLAAEVLAEPQAYARLIEGEAALQQKNPNQAVRAFSEADRLLNTWIGRFDLGRAYLEAGALAEADSEFDRCIKRRGEALALFLDEVPTYGYFPPLYYYQGRTRQGLKSAFAEFYRTYLRIRGAAGEDPLLAEVRHRLGQ